MQTKNTSNKVLNLGSKNGRILVINPGATVELDSELESLYSKELNATSIPEQESKIDYFKELVDIKGIGTKTAREIVEKYPTRALLKVGIREGQDLPFDSDVDELLRNQYGG